MSNDGQPPLDFWSIGVSAICSRETMEKIEVRPFADLLIWRSFLRVHSPHIRLSCLAQDRMKELIERWSKEYDFVIIDSPSLLAVTDAAVLSKMADFTLLVTRHAQSTRKSLERAWRTLRIDPETKVGVVLNAVSENPPHRRIFWILRK